MIKEPTEDHVLGSASNDHRLLFQLKIAFLGTVVALLFLLLLLPERAQLPGSGAVVLLLGLIGWIGLLFWLELLLPRRFSTLLMKGGGERKRRALRSFRIILYFLIQEAAALGAFLYVFSGGNRLLGVGVVALVAFRITKTVVSSATYFAGEGHSKHEV